MPFVDVAKSTAAKAKNILFVGEISPGAKKTQVLFFPLQLPPPGQSVCQMPPTTSLRSSYCDSTAHRDACQEKNIHSL
jgi:hypothetical protein